MALYPSRTYEALPLSPSCSLEIFFRSMKWVASATSFTLPSSHTWIFTLRHKGGNISLKTTCSCHTGSAQFFCTVVRPWKQSQQDVSCWKRNMSADLTWLQANWQTELPEIMSLLPPNTHGDPLHPGHQWMPDRTLHVLFFSCIYLPIIKFHL